MPGRRAQALGAHDGTRQIGAVGDVAAELPVRVGEDHDVVRRPAGQEGDVGAAALARVVAEHEVARVHHAQPELARGFLEGRDHAGVRLPLAPQDQDAPPVAVEQELRQRVRLHRHAGQRVEQVRRAVGLAQAHVVVAHVEQEDRAAGQRVADRQQLVQRQVQQEHGRAVALGRRVGAFGHAGRGVRLGVEGQALQLEGHAGDAAQDAGGVDRHLGARIGPVPVAQFQSRVGAVRGIVRVVRPFDVDEGEGRPLRRPRRRRERGEQGRRQDRQQARAAKHRLSDRR